LRKKIPIPHLNPPLPKGKGEEWGKDPLLNPPTGRGRIPSVTPLEKGEDPFHILPLRKRRGLPPPTPSPSFWKRGG